MQQKSSCYFVILGAILMGSLPVFVKKINLNPLELTFYRLFFGFLFLSLFMFLLGEIRVSGISKNIKLILAITVVNTATIVSYIASIQLIKAATAALLLYMAPVYVLPVSRFLGEKVNLFGFISLPFGIVGLVLMLSPKNFGIGDIFGIFSGIFYAGYFILMKKAREKMSAINITFAYLALSSILLLPAGVESLSFIKANLIMLLGLGLIPTALAFTVFNYGIKGCGAGKSSLTALVEPISAGIFGFIFFGEVLSLKQTLGAFFILLAVFIALTKS